MSGLEIVLSLAIAVGLVGILIPMLPGTLLVAGAILVWAIERNDPTGWAVFAVAGTVMLVGNVVKYLIPGRRLAEHGVPNRTLLLGGVLGVIGFFVVPVVGLPLGFVLGIYLSEWQRVDHRKAWPATIAALKAVGLGILIELSFSTVAAAIWVTAVLAT